MLDAVASRLITESGSQPTSNASPQDIHLKPQVVDLFAGVGGISLGAIRAGFHLALAVELDKHAMASHQKNFPGFNHSEEDISLLTGDALLKKAGLAEGELDGLVGGPPCQGFSVIGQRSADDPRNDLFTKFFELVMQCRPKFFVAENVPGILHKKFSDVRESALQQVADDYTLLDPFNLKASDFGAPTSRERVFFIGYRSNLVNALTRQDFDNKRVSVMTTVGQALHGLPVSISSSWLTEEKSWQTTQSLPTSFFAKHIVANVPSGVGHKESVERYQEQRLVSGCFGTRHSNNVETRYKNLAPGQQDKISKSIRLKIDGLCPTLRAGTAADRGSYQAVRPIHPTEPRVITPREAARLQGFPDWFQFAPSKWHSFRQIGNSVSPILAEAVFQVIYDCLQIQERAVS